MKSLQFANFFTEAGTGTSPVVKNKMSANDLFLTVQAAGDVDLTVKGLTDGSEDTEANWVTLRVIDMQTYTMTDKIESAGLFGVPLGAVEWVKVVNGGGTVTVFGTFGNQ